MHSLSSGFNIIFLKYFKKLRIDDPDDLDEITQFLLNNKLFLQLKYFFSFIMQTYKI
jgi:hypothetical protein